MVNLNLKSIVRRINSTSSSSPTKLKYRSLSSTLVVSWRKIILAYFEKKNFTAFEFESFMFLQNDEEESDETQKCAETAELDVVTLLMEVRLKNGEDLPVKDASGFLFYFY